MESDLRQHPPMFLDQQQQMNSGLTRYRSAPSSYFSNIIDKEFYESIFNRPSSPETERVFAWFMNSLSGSGGGDGVAEDSVTQNTQPVQQVSVVKEDIINQQSLDMPFMNNEPLLLQQQQQQQSNINNYGSSTPQCFYHSSGRPPLPNQMKTGRGSTSSLTRHRSSPAGLFSNINIEGYAAIRGMGTLGAANSTSEEANFSPATRLKNAPNYSSGLMSSRADIGNESNKQNNPVNEAFAESQGNDFIAGFPVGPWDDSSVMADNLSGIKRPRDDDVKPFSGLNAAETQNETGGQPSAPLAHQLSMPNTPMEMATIEKFLHSSDSVPWKICAKRGCATHPRSIAERVRRTKISERMRKLQDLVPNMDNQTKTADMLDLAVKYIKGLQKQVQKVVLSVRVHTSNSNSGKEGGYVRKSL